MPEVAYEQRCPLGTLLMPYDLEYLLVRNWPRLYSFVAELAGNVIPVEMSDAAVSLLVGISPSVVPIKCEVTTRASINTQFGNLLDFLGTFDRLSERKDRTRANKER